MIESDGERGASSIKIIFRKESFRSEIKCDIKGKLVKATLKSFSLSMGGEGEVRRRRRNNKARNLLARTPS